MRITSAILFLAFQGLVCPSQISGHIIFAKVVHLGGGYSASSSLWQAMSYFLPSSNSYLAGAASSAIAALPYSQSIGRISVEGSNAVFDMFSSATNLYLESLFSGGNETTWHTQEIHKNHVKTAESELEKLIPEGDNITAFESYSFPLEAYPLNYTHGIELPFRHYVTVMTMSSGNYLSVEKWDTEISVRKADNKDPLLETVKKGIVRHGAENRTVVVEPDSVVVPAAHFLVHHLLREIPKGYNVIALNCESFAQEMHSKLRDCDRYYKAGGRRYRTQAYAFRAQKCSNDFQS